MATVLDPFLRHLAMITHREWVGFGCAILVLNAVAFQFFEEAHHPQRERVEQKSVVSTLSMMGFFLGILFIIRLGVGGVEVSPSVRRWTDGAGMALMLVGTLGNLWGRWHLGRQWSDHVRIYHDHGLVRSGPYRLVRHPLYATLIMIFFGLGLLYVNGAVILANLLVFLPAMMWRASQEEEMLTRAFPKEYPEYCRQTGQLFPRLWYRDRP